MFKFIPKDSSIFAIAVIYICYYSVKIYTYRKLNEKWYKAFIPCYNSVIVIKVACRKLNIQELVPSVSKRIRK